VCGLLVRLLDGLLMLQIAAMVSLGTRALGVLPVFASSILLALAAAMLVKGPKAALAVATARGAAAGALGYLIAFFAEFRVGPSQTRMAASPALIAFPYAGMRATLKKGATS